MPDGDWLATLEDTTVTAGRLTAPVCAQSDADNAGKTNREENLIEAALAVIGGKTSALFPEIASNLYKTDGH